MPVIALDCRYITDQPSGIGNYVRGLVEWLPKLAPDIEWLFLRSPRAPAALSREPNVREQVVASVASGPTTMWALPLVADLRGVDAFHGTFNIQPAGLTMPVITTVHDTMWLAQPECCRRSGLWGLVETFYWGHGLRRALRRSQRLLTVSEASRRAIGQIDARAAERTRVTPLGIEPGLRAATPEDASVVARVRARHLPGVKNYILSVGQFAGYKNHQGVVRSFALAFRDRPDMELVFVHRLGESSRLVPLARELGVADRLRFLHGLNDEEMRALFWGATCLCHPSFIEGFGLPVAEAMACGCPVVTSRVSAMPEVAGDAALLVDPHDDRDIARAMLEIEDDPELADDLRARGVARARAFQWRHTAERTLSAYREVC